MRKIYERTTFYKSKGNATTKARKPILEELRKRQGLITKAESEHNLHGNNLKPAILTESTSAEVKTPTNENKSKVLTGTSSYKGPVTTQKITRHAGKVK